MKNNKNFNQNKMSDFIPQAFTNNPIREFKSKYDSVRIIALGGFGDVTQNMFVYEYVPNGDLSKSQIIIVDCGVGFPEEDTFGVDLQIPDTHYLEDKKDRIAGIFITHGHEDHIGAIRFVLNLLGKDIPIFAPRLAAAFIQSKLVEFNLKPNLTVYEDSKIIKRGVFSVDPIRVTHSIPDTFHFAINTPIGTFYHGSDYKFDLFPLNNQSVDFNHIARVGDQKVLCLLSDCLGADHKGYSPSEGTIAQNFKRQITETKHRVFVTSISSNIVRWSQAIEAAKSNGRKIVVVGYSVEKAINIAKDLGYLNLKEHDIIPVQRSKNFPDDKLLFLVAGFAGQPESALSKMVMGKHRVKIKAGDKVIFSAPDYIPGTSTNIYNMIDTLSKMGVEVSYGDKEEIHVSGHGYQKEHALLIDLVKPKYLLPIGGNYRHVKSYFSVAEKLGYKTDQFVTPEYDSVATFSSNGNVDTNKSIVLKKVLIDGLGIGDVGVTVLRDRKTLAEDGMFSVVLLVDVLKGTLCKDPVILSRGFVFMKENNDLISYLKEEIKKKFKQATSVPANLDYIREQLQGHIEQIIMEKTGRQPMVLPLIIEG
jgi:ribonuclease J